MPPPEKSGSGKSCTPCLRMHAANARACLFAAADWAGLGCPPFGSSLLQVCCAAPNVRDLADDGSMLISPWPFGSGKFGTPCLRMQAENLRASAAVPALITSDIWGPERLFADPPWAAPPDPVDPFWVEVLPVFDDPTFATGGDADPPPPHPATTATREESGRARDKRRTWRRDI